MARKKVRKAARKAVRKAVKRPARTVRKPARSATGKRPAKKTARRPAKPQRAGRARLATPRKYLVGKVSHFYTNIGVIVVELTGELKVGDVISVEGATTNFTQKVESMQVDRVTVKRAGPGDSIGLKIRERAREGDSVFRL